MKQYLSNRIRAAFKIEQITEINPTIFLLEDVTGEDSAQVNDKFMARFEPHVGGYYLKYLDDGYESFCPAAVFENGSNVEVPEGVTIVDSPLNVSDDDFLVSLASLGQLEEEPGNFVVCPNECVPGDAVAVSRDDMATEALILAAGLNAPRVVPDMLIELIDSVAWYRVTGTLTVCVVTLINGFTVTGNSACVSLENFNWEIGKKIALENAVREIWPLRGFMLKEDLRRAESASADEAAGD